MSTVVTTAPPRPAAAEAQLVRGIGLSGAILLVIGSVIGSGIFLTTGTMIQELPSTILVLSAWTAGGLLAMAGGLTYAEMGSMFPRSGGLYVFLSEAYGALWGFLFGWACLLVILTGSVATVAVGFAEYFSYFFPALGTDRVLTTLAMPWGAWSISAGQLVAAGSIAVITAINYVGVRSGNMVNVVLTAAKVAGLATLPIMAIVATRVEPTFVPVVPPDLATPVVSFGIAMIAVLWAYEGWYFVAYAAGEIKDPQRNLPRALIYGILALTTVYLSVNVAYFYALTIDEMKGVSRIAERAASTLAGPSGATFVALTVVLSTFGCNAAAILAGSRLLYAMAADGVFLPAARTVHPRYRTPHIAILGLTAWSTVLALSGTYEQLFTYVMFTSILFSVAGGIALFVLRRKMPAHPRPYRTWGYPIVPIIFIAGSLGFVANTLMERPVESLAGLGLLALGLPAYWYWQQK